MLRRGKVSGLLVCLVVGLLAVAGIGPVRAAPQGAVWVVNTTADDGPGSLRQALALAESGDQITFDPAVFPPEAPAVIQPVAPLPDLIQGNLTLTAGQAGVILDGSLLGREVESVLLDDVALQWGNQNLLENGDFNAGLAHWRFWQPGEGAQVLTTAADFTSPPAAFERQASPRNGETRLTYLGVAEGQVVSGGLEIPPEAFLAVPAGQSLGLRLNYRYGNVGYTYVLKYADGHTEMFYPAGFAYSGDWQSVSETIQLPPDAVGIALEFIFSPVMAADGLKILSDGNVIAGLQVINFPGNGIALSGANNNQLGQPNPWTTAGCHLGCNRVSGNLQSGIILVNAHSNRIQGNWIGLDATGRRALSNGMAGLALGLGAHQNLVGGVLPGQGNIISANSPGVDIGAGTSGNQVFGNWIGLDATGQMGLGNDGAGLILLDGASANWIGGTASGEGNLIAANHGAGVYLSNQAADNDVVGNVIGLGADLKKKLGNLGSGVHLALGAHDNRIGPENEIAFNLVHGIEITGPETRRNTITRNSIHDNQFLAIKLSEGANDGMADPAALVMTPRLIAGSAPGAAVVELYADPHAQAGQLLAVVTPAADGGFRWIIPAGQPLNGYVCALATDDWGNTSELSPAAEERLSNSFQTLTGVVGPVQASTDPAVLGANLLLALVSVLVFGMTSNYFNKTLENYPDEVQRIRRWLQGGRPIRSWRPARRGGIWLAWLGILLLGAVIESFLEGGAVFSPARLGLIGSLFVAGLIFDGIETGADWLAHRRFLAGKIETVNVRLLGLVFCILSVVISRLADFAPGYLYGIVGAIYLLPEVESRQGQGWRAFITILAAFLMALACWGLSGLAMLQAPALESLLLTIFLVGLQYVLFTLFPLDVFEGYRLWQWKRWLWFALFAVVAFTAYHLLLNPSNDLVQALEKNSVQTLLILLGLFTLGTVAFRVGVGKLRQRAPVSEKPTAEEEIPVQPAVVEPTLAESALAEPPAAASSLLGPASPEPAAQESALPEPTAQESTPLEPISGETDEN